MIDATRRTEPFPVNRRIRVAYDGSEEAYRALMQAARAAIESGAEIGVVTVLPRAFVPKLVAAGDDAARILREHELEPTLYAPTGDPATEIARVAEEGDYEAIYVGRRSDGSLARALMGSVSEAVIHATDRTTVIAR